MGRQISANYTAAGTQFQWADTDDEHPLFPEDLGRLAAAFDQHTHVSTRGLAVGRVADNSIHAAAYQAASIATSKLQDGSVTGAKIAAGTITSDKLATLSGQIVHGTNNIIPGTIGASSLAIMQGNPAIKLGPLGHASYGSIAWNGDSGSGSFVYDSLSGGSVAGGRFIMQARNTEFHVLNAGGTQYGGIWSRALDIQSGGAGIVVRDSPLSLLGTSQFSVKKQTPDNGDMYVNAGVYIEASAGGIPSIGFHRPGVTGAAIMIQSGDFYKKATDGQQYKLWDANNDGAGSGLDADLLDGVQGSGYSLAGHTHGAGAPGDATTLDGLDSTAFALAGHSHGSYINTSGDQTMSGVLTANRFAVSSGNMGSASDCAYRVGANGNGIYSNATNEVHFASGNTERGRVDDTGELYWEYPVNGSDIVDRSDERIKRNIRRGFKPSLKGLRDLPVSRFKYAQDEKGLDRVGFIAQDVQAVAPWAVIEHAFKEDRQSELGISLPSMMAMLVLAYQEQEQRLEALEKR